MRIVCRLVFGLVGYFGVLSAAVADIHFVSTPSQTLRVRFNDAADTEVDLNEGTGDKVGLYTAVDADIENLPAGTYVARVLDDNDEDVGVLPIFHWSGTTEITPSDKTVAAMYGYNNVLHVGSGQTYSTIAAAEADANAGDLIVVNSGNYTDFLIGDLDRTYYLAPGVVLDGSGGTDSNIFDGATPRFKILGHGQFVPGSVDDNRLIDVQASGGQIVIEGEILSDGLARTKSIIKAGFQGVVTLKFHSIQVINFGAPPIIELNFAYVNLACDTMILGVPIAKLGDSLGRVAVRCPTIVVAQGATPIDETSTTGTFTLFGVVRDLFGNSNGLNAPASVTLALMEGGIVVPNGRPSLSGSGTILVSDAFAYDTASATATNIVKTTAGKIDAYLPDAAPGATNGLLIAGSNAATTVNITGNLSGSVGSVASDVTVGANNDKAGYSLSQAGLADFFDANTGLTFANAVPGSVVKEIADHATTPSLTAAGIADAVLDELLASHTVSGSLGDVVSDIFDFLDGAPTFAEAMSNHGYTTERAEKIDRLAPSLLLSTTIDGSPASNTSLVLADAPLDDNALNGALVIVTRDGANPQKAVALVKDYDKATKTLTLVTDPSIFEFDNEDQVDVIASGSPAALWLGGSP